MKGAVGRPGVHAPPGFKGGKGKPGGKPGGKPVGAQPVGKGDPRTHHSKGAHSRAAPARSAPAARPAPAAPRLTTEQLQERLYDVIGAATTEAAAPIGHLGGEWGEAEIIKRVTKHVYKAACNPEVMDAPWEKMCYKFVELVMQSYGSACQEMDWFFCIDLPPVLFAAVWEILMANGQDRVSSDLVYEGLIIEYEDSLDRTLLDRAFAETAKETFGEIIDDKQVGKIWKALSLAYWPSLDKVLGDRITAEMQGVMSPEQELAIVENFFKEWMDNSLSRCWGSIPDSEQVLTVDNCELLFRTLIAPFGKDDAFSCIPPDFTATIGRPPTDWAFISDAITDLFSRWGMATSKKRRKAAAAEVDSPVRAPVRRGAAVVEEELVMDEGGHPQCTSEGDCIGSEADGLMQHILDGQAGDVYCDKCWDSFTRRNPNLEGVPVE